MKHVFVHDRDILGYLLSKVDLFPEPQSARGHIATSSTIAVTVCYWFGEVSYAYTHAQYDGHRPKAKAVTGTLAPTPARPPTPGSGARSPGPGLSRPSDHASGGGARRAAGRGPDQGGGVQ